MLFRNRIPLRNCKSLSTTKSFTPLQGLLRSDRLSTYVDRHIGPQKTKNEYETMLKTVGYESMAALLDDTIPSHIRLDENEVKAMEGVIGAGKDEYGALSELKEKMSDNLVFKSYIGMGYYNTLTPTPILRNMLENPSWYTPYTPYQAEIAQGRLEMLLNFQTMVKDIVGKEISNASLLDEATACAEAMTMALNISKKKKTAKTLLISNACHPQNIAVVQQRAKPLGIQIKIVNDYHEMEQILQNETTNCNIFGALIQYPDTFGNCIPNIEGLSESCIDNDIHLIASTDLMACSLLKPPGEYGIDIVVGSAQRFGVPLGFGGPHAAFLACDDKYVRKMPGRLIGITKDSQNKSALRMALQTREQFIRRDKATSNICTAQALLANVSAAYAIYHGPNGIKQIANRIHTLAAILSNNIKLHHSNDIEQINKIYFDTITLKCNDSKTIVQKAKSQRINFREIDDNHLSISIDETTTMDDICTILNKIFDISYDDVCYDEMSIIPASFERNSLFLQHETFNQYHSETSLMRYLYNLERKDLGLNTAMIPLGSCTMKLNSASVMLPITWNEVNNIHPFVPLDQAGGYLSLIRDMEEWLCAVTGFDAVSLQPNSGAAGEYTGLSTICAYHESRQESHRNVCLIPTSAHGTNPASAAMCGLKIVAIKCNSDGYIDMIDLGKKAEEYRDKLAVCMITYPSTHGVFEDNIIDLCDIIHSNGGLVYMDGANLQAQLTITNPARIGADVCHLNLHKTFCIPHGGGGPGLGPIGVNAKLAPFLPSHPVINNPNSNTQNIGPIASAPWSSASILCIPWMYIRMMGFNGLREATSVSILAANYMAKRLEQYYKILYRRNGLAAHEFIIDCSKFSAKNPDNPKQYLYKIGAEDIAKRLMDYSFHAPTMSWPVINSLMVEPTESEPLSELDRFCDAMIQIKKEINDIQEEKMDINESPLRNAPHTIDMVINSDWTNKKYDRQTAVIDANKSYWPSVGRVDNEYGDTHKICACPTVEQMIQLQNQNENDLQKEI